MKALSKPLSSPNRSDKFPPPLMTLLRTNVGSRSRGRSRSTPILYVRSKKRVPAVIESTQEPSSPKVTCIGQVRVHRKKPTVKHRRCWRLKKPLFCGRFYSRFGPQKKPFRRLFCKWGSFFRSDYCKKVDATEDSIRVYPNKTSEKNDTESDYRSGSQENNKDFLESSSSPPRNALMLTRCRSAPYRSSSVAGRFWGSPLPPEEEEETENGRKSEDLQESISEKGGGERRTEKSNNLEVKAVGGGAVHPLLLTRCKSEPARAGERLNLEAIFLRETRLDVVQPCSQQNS